MKRTKPEEITENLSDEQLEVLAEMASENPVSQLWIECSKRLSDEQKFQVYRKRGELRVRKEQERINTLTKEEKKKEDEKRRLWYENLDPYGFYGNMGQPETPKEFKNRYGVWPPGYDQRTGEKIESFSNEKFSHYTRIIDGKEILIRVLSKGSIGDNVSNIEVYKNKHWVEDVRVTKVFMSHYLTGWVTDEDKIDIEIVKEHLISGMTCRTIKARNIALEKHKDQRYGIYPYEIHLTNVVNVLLHFGFNFKDDELIVSAWLHDIIEDTDFDKSLLSTYFGENIRGIIEAVSNHKDSTKTKLENKRITFIKISGNEKAIIVKLADRIANIEFSLLHGNIDKLSKYKEEQSLLDELILPKINKEKTTNMFSYLKEIIGSVADI